MTTKYLVQYQVVYKPSIAPVKYNTNANLVPNIDWILFWSYA